MEKCKLCRKEIDNGTEYCDDCIDKRDTKTNESYLDSLLNSVQGGTASASDIYKKNKDGSSSNVSISSGAKDTANDLSSLPMEFEDLNEDLNDFDQFDITEDLTDPIVISNEELYGDGESIANEDDLGLGDNIDYEFLDSEDAIVHNDRENEGIEQDLTDILNQMDLTSGDTIEDYDITEEDSEVDYAGVYISEDFSSEDDKTEDYNFEDLITDHYNTEDYDMAEDSEDNNTGDINEHEYDFEDVASENDFMVDNITPDYEEDAEDNDISALLEDIEEDLGETASTMMDDLNESEMSPENELLNLLNQFNPENPMDGDIEAISQLLGGIDDNNKKEREYPDDVGEVFHEALEAVTDLDDHGIQQITQEIDSLQEAKKGKKKKENKKKGNLFAKVFGNVEYDESDIKKMEAKKAAADTKKSKKKKDNVVGEEVKEQAENEEASDPKKEKAKTKAEARAEKKKAKKEKKESKKDIVEIIDDVDEGRINRVGASIVFLFFGVAVVLLLVTTNIFSYSLSIKNATNYFDGQRYTQAYNEVYGMELKDEDIELYDKIMTVMFVNKQLNSYNNYYHMKKYPEALDSLLKGLQRYDKYVELATMLGIKTDLDYVRNQIVAELYNVFSLTEEEAINILNSENQAKYSISVYDVVLENISYY